MPAWGATLTETDRWNLVNYLRSINGSGPAPAPSQAAIGPLALRSTIVVMMGAWLVVGLRRGRPTEER